MALFTHSKIFPIWLNLQNLSLCTRTMPDGGRDAHQDATQDKSMLELLAFKEKALHEDAPESLFHRQKQFGAFVPKPLYNIMPESLSSSNARAYTKLPTMVGKHVGKHADPQSLYAEVVLKNEALEHQLTSKQLELTMSLMREESYKEHVKNLQTTIKHLESKNYELATILQQSVVASNTDHEVSGDDSFHTQDKMHTKKRRSSEHETQEQGCKKYSRKRVALTRTPQDVYSAFLKLKPLLGVSSWKFLDDATVAEFWEGLSQEPVYADDHLGKYAACKSAKKLLNTFGYSVPTEFSKEAWQSHTWSWNCSRSMNNSMWLSHNTFFDKTTKNAINFLGPCFDAEQVKTAFTDDEIGFKDITVINVRQVVQDNFVLQSEVQPFERRKYSEVVALVQRLREFRTRCKIVDVKTVMLQDPEEKIKKGSIALFAAP